MRFRKEKNVPILPGDITSFGKFNMSPGVPLILTNELLLGQPWKYLRLHFAGTLTGNGTNGTGTIRDDAPLNLFKVTLSSNFDREIIDISSARALYRLEQCINHMFSAIVAPTLTTGSGVTNFSFTLNIPFKDMLMRNPDDTVLHTIRNNGMTMTITPGVIGDIIVSPVNMTLGGLTVDIVAEQYDSAYSLNHEPIFMQYWKVFPVVTPPGERILKLDVQVPELSLKRLLIHVADTNRVAGEPFTGTGLDGFVTEFLVRDNTRYYYGGTTGGVPEADVIEFMRKEYNLSPSGGNVRKAGFYLLDFAPDGSHGSCIPIGDKAFQRLELTYNGSGTTPQVSVMGQYIKKLQPMAE